MPVSYEPFYFVTKFEFKDGTIEKVAGLISKTPELLPVVHRILVPNRLIGFRHALQPKGTASTAQARQGLNTHQYYQLNEGTFKILIKLHQNYRTTFEISLNIVFIGCGDHNQVRV